MVKTVSIIMIGYGGVGRSIIKIIEKDKEYFASRYNVKLELKAICELKGALINSDKINLAKLIGEEDITKSPDWVAEKETLDVLKEVKADFMIECAWTNSETGEPALSHVITALEQKMNVVSSNKGPFYLKFKELHELAVKNGVSIGIESTVGSAIPALSSKQALAGTKISEIRAILNGTSNYILSRMTSEGLSFDLALKEAQELGYAEADPTLDIGGYDAAGKLVILANSLLGWEKTIKDVEIMGIKDITAQAIELAKSDNYYIKHVGIAKDNTLRVGLQLVKYGAPLAVNGTLNVVEIITENAGPILYIGRGAGGPEAASGILSDLIRIAQNF